MIAPDSFELDDIEGHSSAVSEDVPPDKESQVREAAHSCPEQAIIVTEDASLATSDEQTTGRLP